MELTRIAGCGDAKSCPAGYATDRGTVVVQGYRIAASDLPTDLAVPASESVIEVPIALIEEVARALRG